MPHCFSALCRQMPQRLFGRPPQTRRNRHMLNVIGLPAHHKTAPLLPLPGGKRGDSWMQIARTSNQNRPLTRHRSSWLPSR
ncbi:MAG: hypothetical protein OJF52_003419 [Nitrospira sp.]|nr:MAG: hypothetical protein OJF52_003419 [Nitrospira sp.]